MEFKGTKGKWHLYPFNRDLNGRIRNAYISNVLGDSPGLGDIGVFVRINNESEQIDLHNALLISKAPEMLDMLIDAKQALIDAGFDVEQLINEATEI